MTIFNIDGKEIFKCSIQVELGEIDEKIAEVIRCRNALHQAVCALFNQECMEDDSWKMERPAMLKAKPVSESEAKED